MFFCFWIHFIWDGIGKAFGVLVPYIKADLGASTATVGFIGSLHIATSYCFGPINNALANLFGYRAVSLVGAFIVTSSLVASGLSSSPVSLAVFYGVTAGVGICMLITSGVISLNQYFDKKRALANGVATSGTSLGYLASAPILTYLLEHGGLKETFYAEGAVTSVCLVLGQAFLSALLLTLIEIWQKNHKKRINK